jgi:OOP family OmpA-OmpF porin
MSACATAALGALVLASGGPAPSALAQQRVGSEGVCNPVVSGAGAPVQEAGGGVVRHSGSYDCPPAAQEVAMAPAIEPAAAPLPQGGVVLFPFDSSEITPQADATLTSILADIGARQLQGITVAGHTDTSGPADYNDALSRRRAEAVAGWLENHGVPTRVISAQAYGETLPAVPTADGVKLEENRRVVVDFTG